MSTPNNAFATLSTDHLVTATGGYGYGGLGYGGGHPLAHLNNLVNTTLTAQNNQNSQNTEMMTMGMMALAMRNR
jgi:hypothetical protein